MIQRIQTLFILGVFAAFIACFFLPFWNYNSSSPAYVYQVSLLSVSFISGLNQNIVVGTFPIIVLVSVTAILSMVSLFYYKRRELQIRINNYNIFITLIFVGTIFLWIPYMMPGKAAFSDLRMEVGTYSTFDRYVFLFLANVFIKKDEKLVKSADRLRS